MGRRRHAAIFATAATMLIALHLVHFPGRSSALLFGWMPWDLAYHLAWMVSATALTFYMTLRVWPPEED